MAVTVIIPAKVENAFVVMCGKLLFFFCSFFRFKAAPVIARLNVSGLRVTLNMLCELCVFVSRQLAGEIQIDNVSIIISMSPLSYQYLNTSIQMHYNED